MPQNDPINRRHFFRQGVRELLRPLADLADPIIEATREAANQRPVSNATDRSRTVAARYLRPPGALAEADFLDMCSRCGECVRVCPAQCIKIDPTGKKGGGAPCIEARAMPCVVCDGLECMSHCPSGALALTAVAQIDMGTAEWRESTCVRSDGEACTICIDKCPLGSAAIELREGKVHVHDDGCIGCGVCEHECPTNTASIVVIPRSAR